MAYLIVEYAFNPPITHEGLKQMASTLAPCTQARRIRRLRTVISLDGSRGYCELEAADAETVREAYRTARVPFIAVWQAHLYDASPPSEG